MTKKEFWRVHTQARNRQFIIVGSVAAFFSAAVTLIIAMIYSPFMLVASKLIMPDTINLMAILMVAAYGCAIAGTFSFQKAWKEYQSSMYNQQEPVMGVAPYADLPPQGQYFGGETPPAAPQGYNNNTQNRDGN